MTSPRIPPVSPTAKGFLPNSRKEFWPEKPCQPPLATQGGSMRPVEPLPLVAVQSATAQYLAPGTRRLVGTGICSAVFAIFPPMTEFPHTVPVVPPHVEPSEGPPAS